MNARPNFNDEFSKARAALAYLDLADRDIWVKAAMALKSEFGDSAKEMWLEASANCSNFKQSSAESTWKSVKAGGGVSLGTLYHFAKQNGFDIASFHPPVISSAEIHARRRQREEADARANEQRQLTAEAAARQAQRDWDSSEPISANHPYVVKKGIKPFGARQYDVDVILAIKDVDGTIHSHQRIAPSGDKRYLAGGTKTGHFVNVGNEITIATDEILIAEGWATCASIFEAVGGCVVAALDAPNLGPVVKVLRSRYPQAKIVLCGDDDYGTEGNPGFTAAEKIWRSVNNVTMCMPEFSNRPDVSNETLVHKSFVDFNDLARADGIEQVRLCLNREYVCPAETTESNDDAPIAAVMSVEEMIQNFVFIGDGSFVANINKPNKPVSFSNFRQLTAASYTMKGKKQLLHADEWLKHEQRRTVMTLTFRPGHSIFTEDPHGNTAVNTWRPITRGPATVHVTPFLEHVKYLFGEYADKFLDWLAHIEQKPGELPHYGWLHIARETGTGRNWIASVLSRLWKGYFAANVDLGALLESQFNGALAGKLMAQVDEIREGGSDSVGPKFKCRVSAK
ncbi:PriCT-2 domain-containing protein [Caballeronia sp. GAWG1-1]|uniref:PriCT-2 domain-containing protein n=1 Tax=Caballeronia sp. GAWG1-1 TaxID=2921742 RepID=UPI00202877C9|nr:PriCT-2 domain-containing protein [Caballeronia sp. GAWG1-1]